MAITISSPPANWDAAALPVDMQRLRHNLRRAERRQHLRAYALVAPLGLFTVLTFLLPLVLMLSHSVYDPLVARSLPRTLAALQQDPAMNAEGVPGEAAYTALALDLQQAHENQSASLIGTRLNFEQSGLRSLIVKATRQVAEQSTAPASWRALLLQSDARWGQPLVWSVIAHTGQPVRPDNYLHAVDHSRDAHGHIVADDGDSAIYLHVLGRTLWVSLQVTLVCLLLGYPLAYWMSQQSANRANLLMMLVLLPFWTSLLVRTTAWVVLLQKEGIINALLLSLGLIDQPLELIYNRFGVVLAMTHILLPFMVLPLCSVMRQISPAYVRAARSLGAGPWTAFGRVYLPQSLPGISAGVLLVFILALGYYITPALVGGAEDQMMSYFIADHLTRSLNWGLASALGGLLLACVLLLYTVYERYVGISNVRLG